MNTKLNNKIKVNVGDQILVPRLGCSCCFTVDPEHGWHQRSSSSISATVLEKKTDGSFRIGFDYYMSGCASLDQSKYPGLIYGYWCDPTMPIKIVQRKETSSSSSVGWLLACSLAAGVVATSINQAQPKQNKLLSESSQ